MLQAVDRAELLFREALDGLAAAKETITLTKPDGSTLEIPGDLRARAAFIRVGETVLDQLARLRGLFEPQPFDGVNIAQVILLPKCSDAIEPLDCARTPESIERGPVVDVSVEPPTES